MATLKAKTAVDMRDLSELGLLSNFKQLKTPQVDDDSSFTATKGQVSLLITGSRLTVVHHEPASGALDGIKVTKGGKLRFEVDNLGLPFSNTQQNFSGPFESYLFRADDVVKGSGKRDKLDGYGGDDTIKGGGGNDHITGGVGDDAVKGGKGNDTIKGGGGRDNLNGGGGRDNFVFDNKLNGSNIGTIADFKPGKDDIHLFHENFRGIGKEGELSGKAFVLSSKYKGQSDVIVYFKKTGELAYDFEGGSLSNAVQFAKVKPRTNLDHDDFIVI